MLVGELSTFKHYKKKNNLLARQIDTKFLIKNVSPRKSTVGEPGDYVAIDDAGNPYVISKNEFESTFEEIE